MEVKDKLKPYLGTKTILIIDSEEDWLQLHVLFQLRNNLYKDYRHIGEISVRLSSSSYSWDFSTYYKEHSLYSSYNFIHSKDLLNTTRKYNLWKLKLTT